MNFTEEQVKKVMGTIMTPNTAINCRTREEAILLLSILSREMYWYSGDTLDERHLNWEDYEENTVYHVERISGVSKEVGLLYGHRANSLKRGRKVIWLEDIIHLPHVSLLDILSA